MPRYRPSLPTGLAALVALCASGSAYAASCSGEIQRLTRQFDLATEAPRAIEPRPVADEHRHPDGDPSAALSDDRPSAPPDAAATASGGASAAGRRMTDLLQAAQAAARDGNEQRCLEHVREALAVPGLPSANERSRRPGLARMCRRRSGNYWSAWPTVQT
jgi:hypothetical protein